MRSKFLSLNWRDVLKSLVLAFISAILTGIYQILLQGNPITWEAFKPVLLVALGTALSYFVKNVLTNSKGEILTPEPKN